MGDLYEADRHGRVSTHATSSIACGVYAHPERLLYRGLSGPEGVRVAVPEDIMTDGFMSNMASGTTAGTPAHAESRGRLR